MLDPTAVPDSTKNTVKDQIDFVAQISDAKHHEKIFEILDVVEFWEISSRLRYLHEITQDFDPEDPPMELESLRQFALFCISNGNSLPKFQIGISPNGGFLQIKWSSNRAADLMKFLPDGNIRYAGISKIDNKSRSQNIQGSGSRDLALRAIQPFIIDQ